MSAVHAWWSLKHLASALMLAGLLGGAALADGAERQRAVYALATPGLLLTWIAGYGVMRHLGHSLSAPWISLALLSSLAALAAAAWSVEQQGRRAAGWLAVVLYVATVVVMVLRPGGAP